MAGQINELDAKHKAALQSNLKQAQDLQQKEKETRELKTQAQEAEQARKHVLELESQLAELEARNQREVKRSVRTWPQSVSWKEPDTDTAQGYKMNLVVSCRANCASRNP